MELPEQRFACEVARFVELCEAQESDGETAEQLYRSLTELMIWVWRLPKAQEGGELASDDSEVCDLAVSKAERHNVYSKANTVIATQFYDHTWADGEVTTGDTADDLAEIYGDLKLGLLQWRRGDEQSFASAVWQWRFSHSSHWRQHALGLGGVLQGQVRRAGVGGVVLVDGEEVFFEDILSTRPEWRPYLSCLPKGAGENWSATLVVPSPTQDPFLAVTLWLSDRDPSIGFGGWHAHLDSPEGVWSYVRAIEEGLFVVATDVGGEFDGSRGILDLREPDALLEYLTQRSGPPSLGIRTFSGQGDRTYP